MTASDKLILAVCVPIGIAFWGGVGWLYGGDWYWTTFTLPAQVQQDLLGQNVGRWSDLKKKQYSWAYDGSSMGSWFYEIDQDNPALGSFCQDTPRSECRFSKTVLENSIREMSVWYCPGQLLIREFWSDEPWPSSREVLINDRFECPLNGRVPVVSAVYSPIEEPAN